MLERGATQLYAVRVIGNLASQSVDANANETKDLLYERGAFPRVSVHT